MYPNVKDIYVKDIHNMRGVIRSECSSWDTVSRSVAAAPGPAPVNATSRPLPVAGHGQGGDKSFKLCDNSAGGAGQVFARHPETDG